MYPVIDNPGQYKAAIYARLSKEDDNKAGDDSESIKNQIALIQDYAEKQKISICETYVDDGISGTTSERPDLERMINDIIEKNDITLHNFGCGEPVFIHLCICRIGSNSQNHCLGCTRNRNSYQWNP